MSKLTDQLSQNLINHRDYPLVKSVEANTWYTGRDLEEDVAALRDQFAEQKIGAGDQVLIALPNSPVFYRLIRRSGKLGLLPIQSLPKPHYRNC
ncbi:Acyl-CoA synthetase family protein [Lacticaseibacillus rhamnosus MTCC 5462]|nr:Acyl-CoA synthetase family protein [Lacticaseibacillus rhamnosus MTCC 5462]